MFLIILESGDKTNNIGDKFKAIRLILINTYRYLGSFYSFLDMKNIFWTLKENLKHENILNKISCAWRCSGFLV